MAVVTDPAGPGVTVEGGATYSVSGWLLAASEERSVAIAVSLFPTESAGDPMLTYSDPVTSEVGEYVNVSAEVAVPTGSWRVVVGVVLEGTDAGETFYADDIEFWEGDLETATPVNLLSDGESTFERAAVGWLPLNGSTQRMVGPGYWSPTALRYTVGAVDSMVPTGISTPLAGAGAEVDPELTYSASAQVAVADGGEAGWVQPVFVWSDDGGEFLTATVGDGMLIDNSDGYQPFDIEAEPPEDAAYLSLLWVTAFDEGRKVMFDQMTFDAGTGEGATSLLAGPARDFETEPMGWSAQSATLARNFDASKTGMVSMVLKAEGPNAAAITDFGTRGVPIEQSLPVEMEASVATFGAVREVTPMILFHDAEGNVNGVAMGSPVPETAFAWTTVTATGIPPADAEYASVGLMFNRAVPGEAHYIDSVRLSAAALPECLEPEPPVSPVRALRSVGQSVGDDGPSSMDGASAALDPESPMGLGEPAVLTEPPTGALASVDLEVGTTTPDAPGLDATVPETDLPETISAAPPVPPAVADLPGFARQGAAPARAIEPGPRARRADGLPQPASTEAFSTALMQSTEEGGQWTPEVAQVLDESMGFDAVQVGNSVDGYGYIVTGWAKQTTPPDDEPLSTDSSEFSDPEAPEWEPDAKGRFVAVRYLPTEDGGVALDETWGNEDGHAEIPVDGRVIKTYMFGGSDRQHYSGGLVVSLGAIDGGSSVPFVDSQAAIFLIDAGTGEPYGSFSGGPGTILVDDLDAQAVIPGDIIVDDDGSFYAAVANVTGTTGSGESLHYEVQPIIHKYDEYGAIDTSFGDDGHVQLAVGDANRVPTGLAIADDYIYVALTAGMQQLPDSSGQAWVARYTKEGELDTDFGYGGYVAAATQPIGESGYVWSDVTVTPFGIALSTSNDALFFPVRITYFDQDGLKDWRFGTAGTWTPPASVTMLEATQHGLGTDTVGLLWTATRTTQMGISDFNFGFYGLGGPGEDGPGSGLIETNGMPLGGFTDANGQVVIVGASDMNEPGLGSTRIQGDGVLDPKIGSTAPPVPTAGDPVELTSGNYHAHLVDLPAPANAPGVDWGRDYNSLDGQGGLLGGGWQTSFSQVVFADGEDGPVTLRTPDGAMHEFARNGSGDLVTPPDVQATMTEPGPGGWDLEWYDGSVWHFAEDGLLASITEPDTTSITVTRDVDSLTIEHSTGYTLTAELEDGHITSVTTSDHRIATYTYDDLHLATAETPAGTWTYASDGLGRATSEIGPDGVEVVSHAYDPDGRVVFQKLAGRELAYFCYDPANSKTTVSAGPGGGSVTYTYDENGHTTSIEDPYEEVASFTYDEHGALEDFTSRAGSALSQTFDDHGNLLTSDDGTGNPRTYTWDEQDRLATSSDEITGTTTYTYDGDDRIASQVTDPLENSTTRVVDDGLVTSTTDADGVTTTYEYDPETRELLSVTDGEDNTTSYERTVDPGTGHTTTTITDPGGGETTTVTDAAGRVLTTTDPLNRTTTNTYNEKGQLTSVEDPAGAVTSYAYNAVGLLAADIDPYGRATVHFYDAWSNEVLTVNPEGNTTQRSYDPLGRLMSVRDEAGRISRYEYDTDGNQTKVIDPNGAATQTTYDDQGRITSQTDANGLVTTTAYNELGQVETVTAPGDVVTSYIYDELGRQTSVTDARGGETSTTYTPGGRVDVVTHSDGTTTDTDYDLAGRPAAITGPIGQTTIETAWYPGGHSETTTAPGGLVTISEYDAASQLVTITDPAGLETTRTYDLTGRLDTTQTGSAGMIDYDYDLAGNLSAVTDANDNTTTFTYDWRGNKLTQTDALDNTTRWTYDSLGELASKTDPLDRTTQWSWNDQHSTQTTDLASGRVLTSSFDPGGRLIERTAGEDTWTYGYNDQGWLAEITGPGGETSFAYDAAGAVESIASPSTEVESDYDEAGRRTVRTVGDTTVTYSYDPETGLLTGAEVAAGNNPAIEVSWGYDDSGRLEEESFPGGERSWSRTDGRLTAYTESIGSEVSESSLIWDSGGRPSSIVIDAITYDLTWDDAGQLTGVDDGATNRVLTYTALGQRLTDSLSGTYEYDEAGQLERRVKPDSSEISYLYDADGRRTEEDDGTNIRSYTYDARGQLATIEDAESTNELEYGNDGELIANVTSPSEAAPTTRVTVWDPTAPPGLDLVAVDGRAAVAGPGHLSGLVDEEGTFDPVSRNLLDSVTDELDPWGEAITPDDLSYRSELRVGPLLYLRNRYLDSATGQFLSADPLAGIPGSPVVAFEYHYANNSPITCTDPSGLRPTDCSLTAEAAALDANERLEILDGLSFVQPASLYSAHDDQLDGLRVFTQWEIQSGRIASEGSPDSDSLWWRQVNGSMMLDIQAATAAIQAGGSAARASNPRVQAWIDYRLSLGRTDPSVSQRKLWEAHQKSLYAGIECSWDAYYAEAENERILIDGVLANVGASAFGNFPSGGVGSQGMAIFLNGLPWLPFPMSTDTETYPDYGFTNEDDAWVDESMLILALAGIDGWKAELLLGLTSVHSGKFWTYWTSNL